MSQVVACLPSKCKALSSKPSTKKERKERKREGRKGRNRANTKESFFLFIESLQKMHINLLCFDLKGYTSNFQPFPSQFSRYYSKMYHQPAFYYL
jgi:hypothetical protein